jgi:hypothetical protein
MTQARFPAALPAPELLDELLLLLLLLPPPPPPEQAVRAKMLATATAAMPAKRFFIRLHYLSDCRGGQAHGGDAYGMARLYERPQPPKRLRG